MKGLREKFRKNEGFTLVEMLIVVAIIAILIAVSIPLVGSSLEKARHSVDEANNRSAMALGSVKYLSDYDSIGFSDTKTSADYYYYVNSAHQGKLDSNTTAPSGYEAVTPECGCSNFDDTLKITIQSDGTVTSNWKFNNSGATEENT